MHISLPGAICLSIVLLLFLLVGHILNVNHIARNLAGIFAPRFPNLFADYGFEDNPISLHPAVRRYAHCLSGCSMSLILTLWLTLFTGSLWSLSALTPILVLLPLSFYFYQKISAALAASQNSPPSDKQRKDDSHEV